MCRVGDSVKRRARPRTAPRHHRAARASAWPARQRGAAAGTTRTSAGSTAARCSRVVRSGAGSASVAAPTARTIRSPRARPRAAPRCRRSRSGPRNQRPSGTAKPIFGRYMMSRRQVRLHRLLQQPLGLAAADLQVRRQRGQPLDQRMVHQRLAHLERVRHAGPVDLGVDVADQVGLEVEVLDQRERVIGAGAGRMALEDVDRVVAPELARERRRVQLAAQVVADQRDACGSSRRRRRAPCAWKVAFARRKRGAQSAFG